VRTAALTSALPLMPTQPECISDPAIRERVSVSAAGPRYFETIGISLIAGHDFSTTSVSAPQGVVINASLARRLWPEGSPVGRRITIGCNGSRAELVLGVVGDSVLTVIGEQPQPHLYRPFTAADTAGLVPIVISTSGDPDALAESVRRSLADLGSDVRVYEAAPFARYVEGSYGQLQWLARMLAAFGLLALLLAVIGLYGLVAYGVARRTREIGVRMALGANRLDVFREVMAQAVGVVLIGLGAGEVLSIALLGWLGSLQQGVHQPSAGTHIIAAMLWLGTAALASYTPAARAAGVNPLVALRHE
jgi:putative ABC transport system permease protein